jgi:TRAP-type C4-dicarboxylate transport system substrate-binding protein
LLAAAEEAGKTNTTQGRSESDKAVAVMQEKGLTVHKVTPEMEKEWRKASEEFYPKIRGKLVPEDVFAAVERLLSEYRAGKSGARP